MRINVKTLVLIIALITGAMTAVAQNGTITPYSRYGYGILSDNASASQQAMGGVGYAMNSGRQINVMNPASYARVDSLTFLFDMGMDLTNLWSSEVNADGKKVSESNTGAGLSYITMQFPLSKRLGMSVGLLPFASVGYAFGNTIENGYSSRSGSGSINELYVGAGYRIIKGLTVGANISYLFGTTVNDTYAIADAGASSLYEKQLEVRDWRVNIGLQYTQPIGHDDLTIGAVFTPGKKLNGHLKTYNYDVTSSSSTVNLDSSVDLQDGYSLPDTWGAGINYNWRQKLQVELDATYQPWSKAKYDGLKDQLADRYKIALGAQYQPAPRGNYLQRIQYRFGTFYNRDYLVVRNNNVREYGASIGFGLPVPGFKTIVSIGVGWQHRQAYPTALIKEDYLNITIGVNFNEMWFRKSKIY